MYKASIGEFIIAILLACYLIVCFSPLRLEYDSIHYFALKDCLAGACPPGFVAATDPHPYGYPLLLWGLFRVGLLHAFPLAFLNLLFLAGALYFVVRLFRGKVPGRKLEMVVILVLLSYPVVKFFSYPLSEMAYLFFSCGCLYFFHLYSDRGRKPGALILALLFAGAAILMRTVGVILLPAMLAELGWQHREMLKRRWGWVLAGLVAMLVCGLLFLKRPGLYVSSIGVSGKGWGILLREHFMEWGELLLNVPAGKIPGVSPGMAVWLLIPVGVLFVCVVGYGIIRWRKKLAVSVFVYIVLYIPILFYWPFFDVRFWIPVIPFVFILALDVAPRPLAIFFVLAGIAAIGFSTYLTFSKPALARSQAGGRYRNEYETYFFGKPSGDSASKADSYVLHILETCN